MDQPRIFSFASYKNKQGWAGNYSTDCGLPDIFFPITSVGAYRWVDYFAYDKRLDKKRVSIVYFQNNYPIVKWSGNGYPDYISSNLAVIKISEIVNCLFSELAFCRTVIPKRDTELSTLLQETRNNFFTFFISRKLSEKCAGKTESWAVCAHYGFPVTCMKETALQKLEGCLAVIDVCREISVPFPFRVAPLTQ